MKRNKVFVIIVVLTVLLGAWLSWIALSGQPIARIPHKPLLIALFALAVSAIYPLYRLGKSWPSFAFGIRLVLTSLLLTMFFIAGPWIGLSGVWSELALDASEGLFFIGVVILVWKAAAKKGQHQRSA